MSPPSSAINRMSAMYAKIKLRFRNYVFQVWLPCVLVWIGDVSMWLGLASESAKALQHQTVQKMRKVTPPNKWTDSKAYDINTLKMVGWTHSILPSYMLSYGVFSNMTKDHGSVFYEHALNDHLHIVTTTSFRPELTLQLNKPLKTVVYSHLAITRADSETNMGDETYRSGDLSNFFNERSWIVHVKGIDMNIVLASAVVHGLVDPMQAHTLIGDAKSYYPQIFMILDDLSEHTFHIGDVVKL